MRTLLFLLFLPVLAGARSGDSTAAVRAMQQTYSGLARYAQGRHAAALQPLERSLRRNPAEDVAAAYYYSLLRTGQELEAAAFRQEHPDETYTLQRPPHRHLLYLDLGPRIVRTTADAGNLRYAEGGVLLRTGARSRLWQSLNLVQDTDPARYRQLGTHSAWQWYAGRKWTFTATAQTAFTQYRYAQQERRDVSYDTLLPFGFLDSIRYRTRAQQELRYRTEGAGQYVALLIAARKRAGSWLLTLEGGGQWLRRKQQLEYRYSAAGITDSFLSNRYLGSALFLDSGAGRRDTLIRRDLVQLGLSGTHYFRVGNCPAALTLGIWYIGDARGQTAAACANLWLAPHPAVWITATAFRKGGLPAAFSGDGLYLAYDNPVRYRAGLRLQYLPLRRFSPSLAYQLEDNGSAAAGTKLLYHAAYLTLKYAL